MLSPLLFRSHRAISPQPSSLDLLIRHLGFELLLKTNSCWGHSESKLILRLGKLPWGEKWLCGNSKNNGRLMSRN